MKLRLAILAALGKTRGKPIPVKVLRYSRTWEMVDPVEWRNEQQKVLKHKE